MLFARAHVFHSFVLFYTIKGPGVKFKHPRPSNASRPASVLTFDTIQQRNEGTKDVWSWGFWAVARAGP